jgi:hypothetical protein
MSTAEIWERHVVDYCIRRGAKLGDEDAVGIRTSDT